MMCFSSIAAVAWIVNIFSTTTADVHLKFGHVTARSKISTLHSYHGFVKETWNSIPCREGSRNFICLVGRG